MSADLWLQYTSPDPHLTEPFTLAELNVTYNLTPMLRETGAWPEWRALEDEDAHAVGATLLLVTETMREDPDRYRALNPENGWGSYDTNVPDIERFACACIDAPPGSVVKAWL